MEALADDGPDLNHATGKWRWKHPPEMVKIDGTEQYVYIWVDREQEDDFSSTRETVLTILDEIPDEPNTRILFVIIQAFLATSSRSPWQQQQRTSRG